MIGIYYVNFIIYIRIWITKNGLRVWDTETETDIEIEDNFVEVQASESHTMYDL